MIKMKQKTLILILALIATGINFLIAEPENSPYLGEKATSSEIVLRDISVFPNGEGLPYGSGNANQGELLYQAKCIACHGEGGLGHTADQLAGAKTILTDEYAEKTIGSYWPYATTLFDFIKRAMPMNAPGSLGDNEVYSLVAYLLYLNNIVKKDEQITSITLPEISMPNQNGFIDVHEMEKFHR